MSLSGEDLAADYFVGSELPAIPEYNITRLVFHDLPASSKGHRGMVADVSLSVVNSYPVGLMIPSLGFDILVPNCSPNEPYIPVADAHTNNINVQPYSDVQVDVAGMIRELPEMLVKTCPNSESSPLDLLLGDYLKCNDTTIFVRGSDSPEDWITKFISSVTVPVPFPGHTFDKVIKKFSLTDTHFSLPDPTAEPGSDEANPQISGNIVVIASLPEEMNFGINVTRVRANADVLYQGQKLGKLNLKQWQKAQSERIAPKDGHAPSLKIQSQIESAPLNISDDDVLTDVLEALLFGGKPVLLKVEALVEVEVSTVLGTFIIKDLPAEGVIPVKR